VDQGRTGFRENSAVRVAGPDRICFVRKNVGGQAALYFRHILIPDTSLNDFFRPLSVRDSFGLCFVFSSPILITPKNGARIGTRRLQLGGQEFRIASEFSNETLRIHSALRRYSAIRSQQKFLPASAASSFSLGLFELWRLPITPSARCRRT
jgi:hypothetical protein